jgi:phytoene synthase
MMCGVIGVTQARALPFAIDLGVGMQLTNICRDVLEDAHRQRVYLPADRLAAAGTSQAALLARAGAPRAVAAVVNDLLLLAEQHYDSAQQGMRYIPTRPRAAIAAASRMYRAIGWRLRDRGGDALQGRTFVPGPHKALHLLRAALTSLSAARGPEPTHDPALHRLLRGLPGTNPPP